MRRAIGRLADEQFDLLVIGGGITGACIARDAARRGLKVALIDKQDFAAATSAHNSKLIHGGLRYLRNFELRLVRESLRERRVWLKIAPHLVQPLPFLLPVFGSGRALLAAGLSVYDLLAWDRGRLDDLSQRLPGHRWLDRGEALAREPVLDVPALKGAFLYYDAQMYSPERLALECLMDADAHGAAIANYVGAERLLLRDTRVVGAAVCDGRTKAPFDITAAQTVVAAGPWSDLFLARALGAPVGRRLKRSKGIHAIVPARTRGTALTVAAESGHFFVLPWRGRTLIGTTDTAFDADPDTVDVTGADIEAFFSFVNRHLPTLEVRAGEVSYAYAGLRPLLDDGTRNTYGASRRAEIVDHASEGMPGLMSVIGGKWTTARALAEAVTNAVVKRSGMKAAACSTAAVCLPGGRFEHFASFERDMRAAYPGISGLPHLVRLYGSLLPAVLENSDSGLLGPIGTDGDLAAQIVHGVRHEMAVTADDIAMRRTGIGQTCWPTDDVLGEVRSVMSDFEGTGNRV